MLTPLTKNILSGESPTEKIQKVAQYVNQWRFRSFKNEVRNLEFFFDKGNTTGNDTLRQFMHVVMCLTLIDIHVTGILLDAAGNNRRFVRYLLGGATKVAGSWIESHFCTHIFVGFCNFFLSVIFQHIT